MLSTQVVSGVAKQHGDINGTSTRKKSEKEGSTRLTNFVL